jgi:hypothetical protein
VRSAKIRATSSSIAGTARSGSPRKAHDAVRLVEVDHRHRAALHGRPEHGADRGQPLHADVAADHLADAAGGDQHVDVDAAGRRDQAEVADAPPGQRADERHRMRRGDGAADADRGPVLDPRDGLVQLGHDRAAAAHCSGPRGARRPSVTVIGGMVGYSIVSGPRRH